MAKLYHYIARPNTALTDGILSFAENPNANPRYYFKRSGKTTHADIVRWFESKFPGRSRGIRAFPCPVRPTEKTPSLQKFVLDSDLFAVDVDSLDKAGLLEAVYVSPSVLDIPNITEAPEADEVLYRLPDMSAIDTSPIDWSVCDDALGRRFAYVRYYLLIVKHGVIPPQFIELCRDCGG